MQIKSWIFIFAAYSATGRITQKLLTFHQEGQTATILLLKNLT